ncbi:centrosomal protein of 131 kDa [Anabrus simplex]|uniref:centrosomal protein of 131 kDa n=1 Tax=Anabrus simplex TaxID=316456 RepID=UPI0035A3BE0F
MANNSQSLQPGLTSKPPLPHTKAPMHNPQPYQMIQHRYYNKSPRLHSSLDDETQTVMDLKTTFDDRGTRILLSQSDMLDNHLEESPHAEERFLSSECVHSYRFDSEYEVFNDFSTINAYSRVLHEELSETYNENDVFAPPKNTDFKMLKKPEPMMVISTVEEQFISSSLIPNLHLKDGCETMTKKEVGIRPVAQEYDSGNGRDFSTLGSFSSCNSNDLKNERSEDSAYVSEECLTEDQGFTESEKESDIQSNSNHSIVSKASEETDKLHKNVSREITSSFSLEDVTHDEEPITEHPPSKCKTDSENKSENSFSVKSELSTLDAPEMKVKTVSTYTDILNVLQLLEEDHMLSSHLSDDQKTDLNGCEDKLVLDEKSSIKLQDLHNYLDEVNKSSENALKESKVLLQAVNSRKENSTHIVNFEDLLIMSSVDLAHEVFTLKLQLEEKSNALTLLQDTLNQQRELSAKNSRQADREMKNRLKQQKEEYEATISRHQKFIDQLIADKKNLSEKCEAVIRELKGNEERHAFNLKASEERHKIELQRAKETFAAAEKLRRERWIDSKTKKIKEMTVKGLEPELQRMNTRHQQELSDLRLLHKQELEEIELRATRRSTQQMDQLREQLIKEKEDAITREKELIRQKLEKQIEQEEAAYQKQQQKLLAEIQQDRERLADEEKRMRNELEEAKKNLTRQYSKDLQQVKMEYEDSIEGIKRRHQNELKAIKETLEIEKETWIHNYKQQQAALLSERESEIREQYKRERDREIELVIERLENDAMQARKEQEQMAENRLKRLKEKYDAEVKDLMTSEEALKNKYEKAKLILMEKEDEIINLKTNLRQTEKELQECKKIADRLSAERNRVKDIVRQEFTDKILLMEQENIRLHERMAEAKAKQEMELVKIEEGILKIKSEKEKELAEVYNRVKLTIANKDKTIHQLKIQHESSLQRCTHLEELLEQQRRDYLLK